MSISRKPVESSHIASIGYDLESLTLEVEFKNGKIGRYKGVPADKSDELMAAESVGRYLARNIKGVYDYAPVEQEENEEGESVAE